MSGKDWEAENYYSKDFDWDQLKERSGKLSLSSIPLTPPLYSLKVIGNQG